MPVLSNSDAVMKDADLDVADCVARVRIQDQDAARCLVDYLYPFVIRIVRRKLPRGAAEEDLAQEIFLRMFDKLDQYRGEVPLHHWVSRIAVNCCLNAIRSQRSRPEWRMADLSEEQAVTLEPRSMAVEQSHPAYALGSRELVERILETLSPEEGALIRMLDIEELSISDVRHVTGWSSAYIRMRAFRARQKLNKRFARLKAKGAGGFWALILNEGLSAPCLQ